MNKRQKHRIPHVFLKKNKIIVIHGVGKGLVKKSVHDTLNDLLKLCEEFQRLDVEGMDRMTGREQYRRY